jgi:hypothetical protein
MNTPESENFFFEVATDLHALPDALPPIANEPHTATEIWHFTLKNKALEQLFLLPEPGFLNLWPQIQHLSGPSLLADLKEVVKYSFDKKAVAIQQRNNSAFMKHVLRLMKALPQQKFLPLLKDILAQPSAYFDLFFQSYPTELLSGALLAVIQDKPDSSLQLIKQKGLDLKAKLMALGAYLEWLQNQESQVAGWRELERLLDFAESKQADKSLIPKGFFDGVVLLLIQYRAEHFEFMVRKWYMFGLVDEQKVGDLEEVVAQLNTTFSL